MSRSSVRDVKHSDRFEDASDDPVPPQSVPSQPPAGPVPGMAPAQQQEAPSPPDPNEVSPGDLPANTPKEFNALSSPRSPSDVDVQIVHIEPSPKRATGADANDLFAGEEGASPSPVSAHAETGPSRAEQQAARLATLQAKRLLREKQKEAEQLEIRNKLEAFKSEREREKLAKLQAEASQKQAEGPPAGVPNAAPASARRPRVSSRTRSGTPTGPAGGKRATSADRESARKAAGNEEVKEASPAGADMAEGNGDGPSRTKPPSAAQIRQAENEKLVLDARALVDATRERVENFAGDFLHLRSELEISEGNIREVERERAARTTLFIS